MVKEGYVNKEIRRAIDVAEEKPEGAIYIIPLRFDDCIPSFERLKELQWSDYFIPNAHERLLKALHARANALEIEIFDNEVESVTQAMTVAFQDDEIDLYNFIEIKPQKNSKASYPFLIGKYPVINAQYERFVCSFDFASPVYWLEFPQFNENCKAIGNWGRQGLDWLQDELKKTKSTVLLPHYWDDEKIGKSKPNHPVVGISWYQASAYCKWLLQNWNILLESKANPSLNPSSIRLPLESEWVIAAGGDEPKERYPWDELGEETTSLKEILRRANINESRMGGTTPVNAYSLGKSPYGVMDMAGNVWEWQANHSGDEYGDQKPLGLRGGSWGQHQGYAHTSVRCNLNPDGWHNVTGFRVAILL